MVVYVAECVGGCLCFGRYVCWDMCAHVSSHVGIRQGMYRVDPDVHVGFDMMACYYAGWAWPDGGTVTHLPRENPWALGLAMLFNNKVFPPHWCLSLRQQGAHGQMHTSQQS